MVDFNKIKEAVELRNQFLSEHPELQPLQDRINIILEKAGNDSHNRQAALQELMLSTWYKIVEEWEK